MSDAGLTGPSHLASWAPKKLRGENLSQKSLVAPRHARQVNLLFKPQDPRLRKQANNSSFTPGNQNLKKRYTIR